jgi:hypothetical protein
MKKKSNKSKVKNATRLELDGHTFRSKLEAFTYTKLIENGIKDFNYEQIKFVLQPSFELKCPCIEPYEKTNRTTGVKTKGFEENKQSIREITYLPDFVNIDENGKGWIIEVKGYANEAFPNKLKMFKYLLYKQGYDVTYYLPNNQDNVLKCIEMIKSKYYNK